MTEHEMLEALKRDDEMQIAKILISTQAAAIAKALDHLEKAHQAVHSGDRIACLHHIADAMAALA